jgi:hypothetical protein
LIRILNKYIRTLGLQHIGPPICAATLKIIPIIKYLKKNSNVVKKIMIAIFENLSMFLFKFCNWFDFMYAMFVFFQRPNCGFPIKTCRNMPFQILMVNCTWNWILNWGFNFIQLNLVNVLDHSWPDSWFFSFKCPYNYTLDIFSCLFCKCTGNDPN